MTSRKMSIYSVCLAVILISLTASSVNAQEVVNKDSENRTNVPFHGVFKSPDDGRHHLYTFNVKLKPKPPSECTFDDTEMNLLKTNFGDWTLKNSTKLLPGKFEVVRYDAGLNTHHDPKKTDAWDDAIKYYFQVDYNNNGNPPTLPAGYKLRWIHLVYTNYPLPGEPSPAIDPYKYNLAQPFEDGLPFYYSELEVENNKFCDETIFNRATGINMTFYDSVSRPFSEIIRKGLKPMWWEGHLYAVMWNETWDSQTVIVNYKGVKWGFEIMWREGRIREPQGQLPWTGGGVAGNKLDWIPGEPLNGTAMNYTVGGEIVLSDKLVSVDKSGLLAPYFGAVSTILVATTTTVIYAKCVKRRKEKQ